MVCARRLSITHACEELTDTNLRLVNVSDDFSTNALVASIIAPLVGLSNDMANSSVSRDKIPYPDLVATLVGTSRHPDYSYIPTNPLESIPIETEMAPSLRV